MEDDEFPVHRLVDGNIDYGFYRAQAARLREQTLQGFWQEIGRWWVGRRSALSTRLGPLALDRFVSGTTR